MNNPLKHITQLYGALLLLCSFASLGATITRGPYIQLGTNDSMIIRWNTDTPTSSLVKFGGAVNALNQNVSDATPKTQHVVTLTGLSALTRYYYSVGTSTAVLAGNDTDTFFETSPLPGQASATRIWVVGDPGRAGTDPTTLDQQYVLEGFNTFNKNQYTDFWLMLGDNAYDDGTIAQYQNAIFNQYPDLLKQSPLWPAMGNHDNRTAKVATQTGGFYDLFSTPTNAEAGGAPSGHKAYYSFDYGNVHVVVLNSADALHNQLSGPMDEWLEDDLANTNADWRLAIFHHAPYGKGGHDSDTERDLIRMRENFLPILEKHGVDLVMAGHNHFYTRTTLISNHYGSSDSYDQATHNLNTGDGRVDGDGAYQKISAAAYSGTVYITHGAGSGGGESSAKKVTASQIAAGDRHPSDYMYGGRGSMVLDIAGDTMKVNVISPKGTVIDHFSITHDNSKRVLKNGVSETITAAKGEELHYIMAVPEHADDLSFAINGGSGDADLYVRFAATPTKDIYDCRPYKGGNNELCTISAAQVGIYHVMALGFADFAGVNLVGNYSVIPPVTTLPDACATQQPVSRGRLNDGEVLCLANDDSISLTIPAVDEHSSMAITTAHGTGNLDLEYSNDTWPNETNVDATSGLAANAECIYLTSQSNHWGYLKVINSSGGASIVVDFDTAGCR